MLDAGRRYRRLLMIVAQPFKTGLTLQDGNETGCYAARTFFEFHDGSSDL
jgi:hypothetical protein